jgi:hypothetical protein
VAPSKLTFQRGGANGGNYDQNASCSIFSPSRPLVNASSQVHSTQSFSSQGARLAARSRRTIGTCVINLLPFRLSRNTIVAVSSQHIGWRLMAHKQMYKTSTSSPSSYSDREAQDSAAGDSCTRKYKTADGTPHSRACFQRGTNVAVRSNRQSRISKSGIRTSPTRTTTSTREKNPVVYAPRARTHARTLRS